MRKPIAVGGPVYARLGDFLRSEPGQSRQKLGLLYSLASLSVADGILGLNWDYGRSAVEKYNEIEVEKENSGRLPVLPFFFS
jgi:hypothetical protein